MTFRSHLCGALAATAMLAAVARADTGVRCEIWHQAVGAQITDTLADGGLSRPADEVRHLPAFELDPAPDDPQVTALRGTIRPPVTGDYTFMVAGDDTALLYLSADDRRDGRRVIASVPSWTPPREYAYYAAQTSQPVHLLAGHRYCAEVWMENVVGASHVSVAWRLPDGKVEAPIPAERLTPATDRAKPPSFDVPPVAVTLGPDPQPRDRPGFHKLPAGAKCHVGPDVVDLSYLLYVPVDFDRTVDHRPLLVFLHGNGHQGSDLWGVLNEGPADFLTRDAHLREAFPMLGLFPQLPVGWRWDTAGAAQIANGLVRQICQQYPRVDRRRVYLTGLSMGGKGSWLTALDDPGLYAAVATMSAVAVRPSLAPRRLAGVPHVRIICGGDDGDFCAGSQAMYAALRPTLGDRVDLTVVPHEGHGVWGRYYPDPAFYQGLMRYAR